MNLVKRIARSADKRDYYAGLIWFGWGVIGGLLPLWGTVALYLLFKQPLAWSPLAKNGEFVLYAASFFAGSLYVLRRDVFPNRNLLTLLSLFALVICTLLFAAVTVAALATKGTQVPAFLSMDENLLIDVSLIVLALSIGFGYVTAVADSANIGFDIAESNRDQIKQLSQDMDRL
jgi:multisubunit Na+/H+ antiporter MnhE subunit